MQISQVIDTEKGIVYKTVTGAMTLNEIRADMEMLVAEPAYHAGMPVLIDMRQATKLLNAEDTAQLAEFIKSSPRSVKRGHRALLVGSELAFGMYRMLEALTAGSPVEYCVFRDEREAHAWVEAAAAVQKK